MIILRLAKDAAWCHGEIHDTTTIRFSTSIHGKSRCLKILLSVSAFLHTMGMLLCSQSNILATTLNFVLHSYRICAFWYVISAHERIVGIHIEPELSF